MFVNSMIKRYASIVFFGIMSLFSMGVHAQNPVVMSLSDISDLPDIEFYDVLEDQHNYIWLSADKGLYRYDGLRYKKFTHKAQKGYSVFGLKLDATGRLWCNNIYGQIFYVENDSLKLFKDLHTYTNAQLADFDVSENKVTVYSNSGIFQMDKTSKRVTQFSQIKTVSAVVLKGSTYLVGLEEDKNVRLLNDGTVKDIFTINSAELIEVPRLFSIQNTVFLWFKQGKQNKLYKADIKTNIFTSVNLPDQISETRILNFLFLNNHYWICTDSGAYIVDIHADNLKINDHIFNDETVTDVLVDFNQNYWFTTLDNGVFVSPNLAIRQYDISKQGTRITAAEGLSGNRFVFGTNNGKLLFYQKGNLQKTIDTGKNITINKLFFDELGNKIIVSTNLRQSYYFDLTTNELHDLKNKFAVAKSFTNLSDTSLLYGSFKEAKIFKEPYVSDSSFVLKPKRVYTSNTANNDKFYVSYVDGLFEYDTTFKEKEILYGGNKILVHDIENTNTITWFLTQHHGLLKYANNHFQEFDVLRDFHVNLLQADGENLWITTDESLLRLNTVSNTYQALNAQDGLGFIITDLLVLQDVVVLITPNQFFIIPKSSTSLFKNYQTSAIKIESVAINDQPAQLKGSYTLPHDKNRLKIVLNSNGYQSNKHVVYSYRNTNSDELWQDLPLGNNFVEFTSLSSGQYNFEFRAKNIAGKQFTKSVNLVVTIKKPFWENYWFYTLVLLAVFTLIWLYFRRRLKQKEVQRVAEIDKILIDKKITNLRLENLRSQMNPHFIFNALNSIQDYIVSNEKELASSYLVKFSRLIRMYLDYSQQNEITLEEELNALKLYLELEKVRFEDELEYSISIDKTLQTKQIKVPSLFVQPYVENALKHGLLHKSGDRLLTINAKAINENTLLITVEDNGIGRKQSDELKRNDTKHRPFATKANQERVRLYKNKLKRNIDIEIIDLYNSNHQPTGTKVVITMPIQ